MTELVQMVYEIYIYQKFEIVHFLILHEKNPVLLLAVLFKKISSIYRVQMESYTY